MRVPKTIEGVCRQKRRFMGCYAVEDNLEQREVYGQAVNYCDRLTAHIIEKGKGKRRLKLLVVLLCLCLMQGCQTVKGVTGDAGWILTELSDNISTDK